MTEQRAHRGLQLTETKGRTMRKALLIAVSVVVLSAGLSVESVDAQQRVTRASNGPLNRLMELERRKNAWLRRTFLGR
jgi:hypothetical protein